MVRLFAKIFLIIVFFQMYVLFPMSASGQENFPSEQSVLILHSSHQSYPWTDAMEFGIQQGLANADQTIYFHIEYLDTKRNRGAFYLGELQEFWKVKFNGNEIDLIIAGDNDAYDFILKQRDTLFTDVPIVFTGFNGFTPETLSGMNRITGVVEENDIEATIDVALQLHPDISKVVFLMPGAPENRLDWVKNIPSFFGERAQFHNITALDLRDVDRELTALGRDIIVIPLNSALVDSGRYLPFQEFVTHLANSGEFPVYGLWDIALGQGIVGGKLVSGEFQGREAAKLALRIIEGTPVSDIPVSRESPNRFMLDWEQLRRFRISPNSLPEGAIVINRPVSFYSANKQLVWLIVSIFVLLLSLVTALSYTIIKRREFSRRVAHLFENSEASILDEDFSVVVEALDSLRMNGVTDLRLYLTQNPHVARELVKGVKINHVNKATLKLFGIPTEGNFIASVEQIFRSAPIEVITDELCAIWGRESEFRANFTLKVVNGDKLTVIISMPIPESKHDFKNIPVTIVDITENTQLEERVRQAQKMEAVGQLTGGIAHDINNILGIVMGNLELLKLTGTTDEKILPLVDSAFEGGSRGAELTKKLLSFSRKTSFEEEETNVNDLVKGMDDFVAKSLTASIETAFHLEQDIWPVKIDPRDLENCLLNLALNARDAMKDGGKLVIETANKVIDDDYVQRNPGASSGEYVLLAVSDTGQGMTAKVRAQVLEPFFTTKEEGQGTGLGLSMVYGFVQRSGGHLKIYSEVGEGTTIRIYLPRARVDDKMQQVPVLRSTPPTGTETILIVDDEEALLKVASRYLESLGYKTFSANNGKQALDVLNDNKNIELLFFRCNHAGWVGWLSACFDSP